MPLQVKTLPVRKIIEYVDGQEWQLPEFQRDFVWKPKKIIEFLESLYRGYPTGSLLVNEDSDPDEISRTLEGQPRKKIKIHPTHILDGQQRITSLWRVNAGKVSLCFDVDEEKFLISATNTKPQHVLVTDVWKDRYQVMQTVQETLNPNKKQQKAYDERLVKLEKILDYNYTIHSFDGDPDDVAEAYVRVNSRGVPLGGTQLMLAILARASKGLVQNKFRQALRQFSHKGFTFNMQFFTKCFAAIAVGNVRFKSSRVSMRNLTDGDLQQFFEQTSQRNKYDNRPAFI